MAAAIRLYLDENLTPKIAHQLRRRSVDAVSVHELGLTGDADANHLARATAMGCVLVTCDIDFLQMAATGIAHAGIVFGVQEDNTIGDWVAKLEVICRVYVPDDMCNHVEYL